MNELPSASQRTAHWKCIGFVLLLTIGYEPALLLSVKPFDPPPLVWYSCVAIILGAAVWLYRYIRKHGTRRALIATEVLVFIVLVGWGLVLNEAAQERCVATNCEPNPQFRPLATPAVYYLCGLHAFTVLAYTISRRRRVLLPARVELVLLSGLCVGCVLQSMLALHFGSKILYGIVFAPIMLPAVSPLLAAGLFAWQIRARLQLRVSKASGADWASIGTLTAFWLGSYGALAAVFKGRAAAGFEVFSNTCDYTFSQLPIRFEQTNCHYLCTVAARGHQQLVRPLRWGVRRGQPILVNRQLAIANAFEDLLTEQFPTLGRLARRTYDRLGLPVSRWIRTPLLADLIYVLMKPAEWLFYVYLLVADPECPEKRLDRMYR